MRRREFITLGGAAAWPRSATAQQRSHIIGLLASQPLPSIQRLGRKLREYGYVDGKNLRFVPDIRFGVETVEKEARRKP
jgi:hypothetical protein